MLLEFKTKNYKSFREEMIFSMVPAPKQTGLDYSVFSQKAGSKTYKGLTTAVVYGANASGKTNLIGAMDTFRMIMLRGNIKNSDNVLNPNHASFSLELIPNTSAHGESTDFSVRFIDGDLLVDYCVSIDLGEFMDKGYPRKILTEKLYINEKRVFERGTELIVEFPDCIKMFLNSTVSKNAEAALEIAQGGLNQTDLFLTSGFKTVFSQALSAKIMNWIEDKFIVIYRSDAVHTIHAFVDPKDDTVYVEKTLTEAAAVFGIQSNALGYKRIENGKDLVLCSVFEDKKIAIPADMFESYGTIRFVNEFPLVIDALLNGGTLVMDEFDASIHPMALMNIINIFHNDEVNKNHAQLVFNTHNPIFLDANLFRRDEIKFVERDEDTHESMHYSLSDFKTSGANGVRKGADYMRNYFVSQYGAIKDIDFSPIIEQLITGSEVTENV